MIRANLVAIVIGSALAVGCGSGNVEQSKAPPGYPAGKTQPAPLEPEVAITKLETSEERVTYLRQLANDSTFVPQQHVAMLQKYAGDKDEEVAGTAKELLDRPK